MELRVSASCATDGPQRDRVFAHSPETRQARNKTDELLWLSSAEAGRNLAWLCSRCVGRGGVWKLLREQDE
jgi:hypothetical protein